MNLYKQWQDLIDHQTKDSLKKFWEVYSETETKIYSSILKTPEQPMTGILQELVDKFEADPVIFVGFLDGIQTSLKTPFDLESLDESSEIKLDIELETLFYNMLVAEAEYLYTLPEWDNILTEEKKKEITDTYKRSRTIVKEKEPGRNDPCPCGSGKKYKKCCGTN